MKNIFTYIMVGLALLMPASVAAESANAVILYMTANRMKVIPFEDAQEISFDGSQMKIGLLSFSLSDIVRYEFGDKTSSIEKVEGTVNGIVIDPRGYIDFSKHNQESPINVYGIDGTEQPFVLKDKVIDISNLSTGVYLVRIGKTSFKMLKK